MKTFVCHKFSERAAIEQQLLLAKLENSDLKFSILPNNFFINRIFSKIWKLYAKIKIKDCDVFLIISFNNILTQNQIYEKSLAHKFNKEIVEIDLSQIQDSAKEISRQIYETYYFTKDFESIIFENPNLLEYYKILISSSESLMNRRQNVNSFFVTINGGVLTVIGYILKEIAYISCIALCLFGATICHSWYTLIVNYGKLNTGKFKVLLKLEEILKAPIFHAEWIALGKGKRKGIYQSFTLIRAESLDYFV